MDRLRTHKCGESQGKVGFPSRSNRNYEQVNRFHVVTEVSIIVYFHQLFAIVFKVCEEGKTMQGFHFFNLLIIKTSWPIVCPMLRRRRKGKVVELSWQNLMDSFWLFHYFGYSYPSSGWENEVGVVFLGTATKNGFTTILSLFLPDSSAHQTHTTTTTFSWTK